MRSLPIRPGLIALLLVLLGGMPAAAGSPGGGDDDYRNQRERMVTLIEIQVVLSAAETGIAELDPKIAAAMREVPRHAFLPEELRPFAYGDGPLPIGYDQNIASPFLIALMTQLAELEPDDVVFETGTGAGYHAALLSTLAARVYSVEVIEPLAREVAGTLKTLGYDNVWSKQADGYYGWSEEGPFDAIIIKEAVDHIPPPLLDQLRPGGRMVVPLGPQDLGQTLTVVEKAADGRVRRIGILPVIFSPLQGGERT